MELTPELLLKLHPSTYWQVWKAGFAEAKNDPQTRKQIAEEYLKSSFTKASLADAAAQASPQPLPATHIDPEQARINQQLGLDEATFQKFAHVR